VRLVERSSQVIRRSRCIAGKPAVNKVKRRGRKPLTLIDESGKK